jgi:hypothetical protein
MVFVTNNLHKVNGGAMSQIENAALLYEIVNVEELEQKTAPDCSGYWSTTPV